MDALRLRANNLVSNYRFKDRKLNFGETDLTVDDFIELCSNGCCYCGETDWKVLGLDRIDNTKPHTKENCVCSCWECNNKKGRIEHSKPILQFTKYGQFIAEYDSIKNASIINGIQESDICKCCKGKLKTAGKCIWKYK